MRRSRLLTAVVWSVAFFAALGTALPPALAFGCCCGTCTTCSLEQTDRSCCESPKPACCSQSCCQSSQAVEDSASSCLATFLKTGQECSCPGCACHVATERAPLTSEEILSGKELVNKIPDSSLGIPAGVFAPVEIEFERSQVDSGISHPLALAPARILFEVWLN